MALEEDIPDHPDDKTIPKYKQIDKVTRSFCFFLSLSPSLLFKNKLLLVLSPSG